jgi:Fic family protein
MRRQMKRRYLETHPWIGFKVDLGTAPPDLWMLIGEARSKIEHISGVPLKPAVQEGLLKICLAKGVSATTAIEGNTLSEEEVLQHLDGQLQLPQAKEYLRVEIDNIIRSCNEIQHRIFSGDSIVLTPDALKSHNQQALHDLELPPEVLPGEYRQHGITVGRYRGAPWEDVPFLISRFTDWINTEFIPPQGQELVYGILKAIIAHLYIAWIHPFGDGNGRTARLVELEILLSVGVPAIAAHLLSNHYNQTRNEYYRQLEASHRSGGDVLPFVRYALQGLVDGLNEQIHTIREQQMFVHWVDFVHEMFRSEKDSPANIRRRRLVIDLSRCDGPVPRSGIRTISPRIAEGYSGKTDKTVKRDLNFLENMEMIVKEPAGYRARAELMAAFLPMKRDATDEPHE